MQIIKGTVLNADGTLPLAPAYPTEVVNGLKSKLITRTANLNDLRAIQAQYGPGHILGSDTPWPRLSVSGAISIVNDEISVLNSQILDYDNKYKDAVATYNKLIAAIAETDPTVAATIATARIQADVDKDVRLADAASKKTIFIIIGVAILIAVIVFAYFKFKNK